MKGLLKCAFYSIGYYIVNSCKIIQFLLFCFLFLQYFFQQFTENIPDVCYNVASPYSVPKQTEISEYKSTQNRLILIRKGNRSTDK